MRGCRIYLLHDQPLGFKQWSINVTTTAVERCSDNFVMNKVNPTVNLSLSMSIDYRGSRVRV